MKRIAALLALLVVPVAACDDPVDLVDFDRDGFAPLMAYEDNSLTGDPTAAPPSSTTGAGVLPSTNADNYDEDPKWAHVLWVEQDPIVVEEVTLNFVGPRGFFSCFEYRIDDEAPPTDDPNFNPGVLDGLWNYTCQNASSEEMTFSANDHVDVRSAFGAETDERFDWTRFWVPSLESKDQCRSGQWEALGFQNQGQCIRYVETGKDSREGS